MFMYLSDGICPHTVRPRLYLSYCLTLCGLDQAVRVNACEEILLLYAFAWPRASLKESLRRLGVAVSAPFRCLCGVDRFNAAAPSIGHALVPWPSDEVRGDGSFVLLHRGAFSALKLQHDYAVWFSGAFQCELEAFRLQSLLLRGDVSVYRLVQTSPTCFAGGAATKQRPVRSALLVQEPWCSWIVEGLKTWELRATRTKKRERVALARSGAGLLLGEATIAERLHVAQRSSDGVWVATDQCGSKNVFGDEALSKHCVPDLNIFTTGSDLFAWVFSNAEKYPQAVPYHHPHGCQNWVTLEASEIFPGRTDGGLFEQKAGYVPRQGMLQG